MRSLIHLGRFLAHLDQPASQVSGAEMRVLQRYCSGTGLAVEIGCFEGATTRALAEVAGGEVYTIDPFFRGRLGICWGEVIAREHCRRGGHGNVRFVRALSHDAVKLVPDDIDFLFVDGDHSAEGIRRDWDDWFPKVRPGGIIALHDCLIAPNSPVALGSTAFYEEVLLRLPVIELLATEGCLAVFRKRSE